jgi:hypothetical protein
MACPKVISGLRRPGDAPGRPPGAPTTDDGQVRRVARTAPG